MRILVCGDRAWTCQQDGEVISLVLDSIVSRLEVKDVVIIQGECTGVDTWAKRWAHLHSIECLSFPADWSLGLKAGPIRNRHMSKEGKPDVIIAFHDHLDASKGTKVWSP